MANSTLLQLTTRKQFELESIAKSPHYLPDIERVNSSTVSLIQDELAARDKPWFLGFSGGKDSSALLKLAYLASAGMPSRLRRNLTVVYCDTGVDMPVVAKLVRGTLRRLSAEAALDGIPITTRFAQPTIRDRYFVKLIGKGYPPPSNKFRWCTDRLRIAPVQRVIANSRTPGSIVLLGIRNGESGERDKTIRKHSQGQYFLSQKGARDTLIFSPLLDYRVEDVWATIERPVRPFSIQAPSLTKLYKDAGGECPSIRDPRGTPCGKGRFGCWTCTVVRKDRAMTSMILEGHGHLQPLLRWRDWLMTVRDQTEFRCPKRRNGQPGPGPFTLSARRMILNKLLLAQRNCPWTLIQRRELVAIRELWKIDRNSETYRLLEGK